MGSITSGNGNRKSISINLGRIIPMPRVPVAGRQKDDGEKPQTFRLPDWHSVTVDETGNIYKSPLARPPEQPTE